VVCIDFRSKYDEARSFFEEMFGQPNAENKKQSLGAGYDDGFRAGEKVNLNPGVNGGSVLALGV